MKFRQSCKKMTGRAKESGNVLFLILIAVALFAALSYAVTQSTRSGGGDAGKETSKISSAQLTQYPAGIRTSLVRMIIGGQNVETLEFNPPADFANCTEYPSSSGKYPRCVFHPSGGGATYSAPATDLVNGTSQWVFNAENEINLVGTSTGDDTVTVPTADLIAFLPDVTLSVCETINDQLGINGIPVESGIDYTSANDMVNPDGATDTGICGPAPATCDGATIGSPTGTNVSELDGQPFGCFEQPAGTYVYYHVLIER